VPLVDTTVAIDVLRERRDAVALLRSIALEGEQLLASEITRFEVLAGMRPDEEEPTEQLLAQLEWLPVTEAVARLAAAFARVYRSGFSGIEDGDYLIAATAVAHEAQLLTTNARHFPMLPGLAAAY
jgi:predicted nucleic acid-binding protein